MRAFDAPTSEIFGFPVVPGQPFSGRFTYDPKRPSQPLYGMDDRVVNFIGHPFGMSLTVGPATESFDRVSMRVASSFLSVNSYGAVRGGSWAHEISFGFGDLNLTDFSTPSPDTLCVRLRQEPPHSKSSCFRTPKAKATQVHRHLAGFRH